MIKKIIKYFAKQIRVRDTVYVVDIDERTGVTTYTALRRKKKRIRK